MDNMSIYEASRSVPKEAQKDFTNGRFSGTDINPMWRIKKLTELFGPAGIGWYYEVLSERAEEHGDVVIAVVDLNLYVKWQGDWSKPIYGTGGNVLLRKGQTSDEGYKMALTDALSVACKALGIGADIYFAKDKTKYTASQEPEKKPEVQASNPCADCGAEDRTKYMAAQEPEKTKAEELICSDCGKPIPTITHKDGKVRMTAKEIAEKSMEAYGRQLCMACSREAALNRA